MAYKIWIGAANPEYNVSIYSRAGAAPNTNYDLYYSEDNATWQTNDSLLNLNSTSCSYLGAFPISSGIIYIKVERSSDGSIVYTRGSNSSTCPANVPLVCTYQATITGNEDVAITVYVDGSGNYQLC